MAIEQRSKRAHTLKERGKEKKPALQGDEVSAMRREFTPPLTGEQQNSRVLRRVYEPYLQYGIVSSAEAVLRLVKHDFPDWTHDEITAMQQSPERLEQKRESARRANLARIDALIDKLED